MSLSVIEIEIDESLNCGALEENTQKQKQKQKQREIYSQTHNHQVVVNQFVNDINCFWSLIFDEYVTSHLTT